MVRIGLSLGRIQFDLSQQATFILENDEITKSLDIVSLINDYFATHPYPSITNPDNPIKITKIICTNNTVLEEIITIPKTVKHVTIEYNANLTHMPLPGKMPLQLTNLIVRFNPALQFVPKGITVPSINSINFRGSLNNLDVDSFENVKQIIVPHANRYDYDKALITNQIKESEIYIEEIAAQMADELEPFFKMQLKLPAPLILQLADKLFRFRPRVREALHDEIIARQGMRLPTIQLIKEYREENPKENPKNDPTVGGKRRKSRKRHRSNKNRRTRKPRRSLHRSLHRSLRRKYSRK